MTNKAQSIYQLRADWVKMTTGVMTIEQLEKSIELIKQMAENHNAMHGDNITADIVFMSEKTIALRYQ